MTPDPLPVLEKHAGDGNFMMSALVKCDLLKAAADELRQSRRLLTDLRALLRVEDGPDADMRLWRALTFLLARKEQPRGNS